MTSQCHRSQSLPAEMPIRITMLRRSQAPVSSMTPLLNLVQETRTNCRAKLSLEITDACSLDLFLIVVKRYDLRYLQASAPQVVPNRTCLFERGTATTTAHSAKTS